MKNIYTIIIMAILLIFSSASFADENYRPASTLFQLAQANTQKPIRPAQNLFAPAPKMEKVVVLKAVPVPEETERYTVERGDMLSRIAYWRDTSVIVLLALNPEIKDKDRIYIGQELIVPLPKNQRKAAVEARRADSLEEANADLEKVNETLKNQMTGLMADNNTLREANTKLNSENVRFAAEKQELTKANEKLEATKFLLLLISGGLLLLFVVLVVINTILFRKVKVLETKLAGGTVPVAAEEAEEEPGK